MTIHVDTLNLNIGIDEQDHITYNGHLLTIDTDDTLDVSCAVCDTSASFDEDPGGIYRWEAILYLLNEFDTHCIKGEDDVKEAVKSVVDDYIGMPADTATIARMEKDIEDVVGEDASVDVTSP